MNAETRAKEIVMSPEERAKAFVEEHRGFDLDGNIWFIACDRAEANLTQAIRQAENHKLEEAARVAEQAHLGMSCFVDAVDCGQFNSGVRHAANAVRSLLEKD